MSNALILCLIAAYAVIAVASAVERNWWRCLYFVAAGLISVAVLGMSNTR